MKQFEATSIAKRMRGYKLMNSRPQIPQNGRETTMYIIDYDKGLDYVSLSVKEALNMSEARACRDKLQEVLRVCNRTRVLVDTTNVIARLSAVEDYKLIRELRHELPSGVSLALLVPLERMLFGRFIEAGAITNGIRLRAFIDKTEAVTWLMYQK